ncbi:unnamed protein product [Diatraea saccharalis]|uniref:Protein-lysine N-methyltransferase EEF2KMT n=1 Tax=Diatraea saccharalis TaxID=40085 RepID=A0A9N9W862_9NEOP|nr:unnamed protein product [Diatraea saccharalis]
MIPIKSESSVLTNLIRKFYYGNLDISLEDKDINELTWDRQEEFLNETINNNVTKKYPIKIDFIKLFFKKLIGYLESKQDVHDDFYRYLCKIMNSENETFYYRHYIIGDNYMNRIIIRETNNLVLNGTTGMRTWEAALMLVDWALSNEDLFRNKHILELGSGVGFTGVAIAKFCQPETVIMSDCHDEVLNVAEENISINFPGLQRQVTSYAKMFKNTNVNIGVMNLDWTDVSILPHEICPEIIVGADIIYDPTILESLSKVFEKFFNKNRNLVIYIAGIIRNEETFKQFLNTIEAVNFKIEYIEHVKNVYIDWNRNIKKYLLKIKL